MTDTSSRSRGWVFTLNNYTNEDVVKLNDIKSVYLIYGREIAPTTGTPHLQGYVYFQNAKSFNAVLKMLPKGIHLEPQNGTNDQAIEYCKKDNDFTEIGTRPSQGKRNDIQIVKDMVTTGKGMSAIIESASNYQTLKMAEMLFKYKEPKRNWKPQVTWLFGESGIGKTRKAYDLLPNAYRKTNNLGKWWDGYDADEDVIIDDVKDLTKEFYISLLELLDRYEARVEVKGGSRQFLAKRIVITSIEDPRNMYSVFNNAVELIRRIDILEEIK